MKPIHLNLASRPYRDYRPVYAAVVVMSLLTAFLMLNNIETYYRYKHETRSTRTKIAQREAEVQQERQRAQAAQRRLETIDLSRLDAQTRFINAKLGERAFSWSALLDDLESVLARDVRLVSVAPTFQADGIHLALDFEARSPNGMVETINRMNAAPEFVNPFPRNEDVIEGGYRFTLNAQYRPAAEQGRIVPARSRR